MSLAVSASRPSLAAAGRAPFGPICPVGQTSLDGTCVSQAVADYVGCIRATGATVASDNSKSLSAAAGAAGVTASTEADVKAKLEKRYATVSDTNALEIIRNCQARTSTSSAAGTGSSDQNAEFPLFRFRLQRRGGENNRHGDECKASRANCEEAVTYWSNQEHWAPKGQTLIRINGCSPANEAFCFKSGASNYCRANLATCQIFGETCARWTKWPR